MPLELNGDGTIDGLTGIAPTAHASTHASAGSDPITVAESQVTGLTSALAGKVTTPGAWTSYTPSIGGTGWSLGDGSISGAYSVIGKTVHVRVVVTWGATSGFGSATLQVGLPITSVTASGHTQSGNARFADASPSTVYAGVTAITSGATVATVRYLVAGTAGQTTGLISSTPFTWASGDGIALTFTYESA